MQRQLEPSLSTSPAALPQGVRVFTDGAFWFWADATMQHGPFFDEDAAVKAAVLSAQEKE
jgi:hypothetical protein